MKLTRRKFLADGSLSAAGLALAFRISPAVASSLNGIQTGEAAEFAPNAYIRIGSDNVVRLWATRSEMGQGVRTILPMVLADELGADWRKIVIEQASPNVRFKGIRLRTSGSGSAVGTWRPLRTAAATAREMLISAAAQEWGVSASECKAELGNVVHVPSGRKLTFGHLSGPAAKLPVPQKPVLKNPRDLQFIGRPTKRLDGKAIVSGAAIYGLDIRVPGMLHAAVARCPYLGGKLVSFDPAPAMKVAGVKHVVPVTTGFATGVAVVAVNNWAAIKGRQALQPVWDKGPNANFDSSMFMQELERSVRGAGFAIRREGDAEAAMNGLPRVLEAVYEYPFQAHAPLETMTCTAHVQEKSCAIWVPTQAPETCQQEAAKLLGVPPESVQINITMLGGGFGRRLLVDYVSEAVEISKAVGSPIQVFWSRDDDMKHGFFHSAKVEYVKAGLDAQGLPVAWLHHSSGPDLSALGLPSAEDRKNPRFYSDDGSPWGMFDNPYIFQHHHSDFIPAESPVPTGPWRAVDYPSTVFARESFIDEIAHAAKIDPLALRLKLLGPEDVLDLKIRKVSRARLRAVLQLAADKAGWSGPLPSADGRLHGRGIACNIYDDDCYLAQVAEVSASKDLSDFRVHRMVSAVDCGLVLNPLGVEGQTESAIAWGMSALIGGKINFKDGEAQERSFGDFKVLRMDQAPRVETYLLQGASTPGGFGETAVPTVAPAIANALFAATGRRMRRLPITSEKLRSA